LNSHYGKKPNSEKRLKRGFMRLKMARVLQTLALRAQIRN
jgi:hypothetical protein